MVTVDEAGVTRQNSQVNQSSVRQLCKLHSHVRIQECLVPNRVRRSPRLCVGTQLVRYGHGLGARKNCCSYAWSVIRSALLHGFGLCR